jgi:hypothetical protein
MRQMLYFVRGTPADRVARWRRDFDENGWLRGSERRSPWKKRVVIL